MTGGHLRSRVVAGTNFYAVAGPLGPWEEAVGSRKVPDPPWCLPLTYSDPPKNRYNVERRSLRNALPTGTIGPTGQIGAFDFGDPAKTKNEC